MIACSPIIPVGRNMFYAADDRSRGCDMDSGMCEYRPGIPDNSIGICFRRTATNR